MIRSTAISVYYLREQLKAIHDELGGENGSEFDQLRAKIAERGMPAEVADRVRQVSRLERMPGVSAEATVVRTYLDTILALPWREASEDQLDLVEAERILDADHRVWKPSRSGSSTSRRAQAHDRRLGARATQILCSGAAGCRQDESWTPIATAWAASSFASA